MRVHRNAIFTKNVPFNGEQENGVIFIWGCKVFRDSGERRQGCTPRPVTGVFSRSAGQHDPCSPGKGQSLGLRPLYAGESAAPAPGSGHRDFHMARCHHVLGTRESVRCWCGYGLSPLVSDKS